MPIANYRSYSVFTQAHELMRTVELGAADGRHYRLEVLRCYSNEDTPFLVRAYVRSSLASPEAWSPCPGYPAVAGDTPQDALHEGMRALASLVSART